MAMGQQPPVWTPPVPQPTKTSPGKIIGFGCLGLVGLFVLLVITGAALGSGVKTRPTASAANAAAHVPTQ